MDLINKIESLRYDIENGVETDVINISVRLIVIKDQALQLQQTGVNKMLKSFVEYAKNRSIPDINIDDDTIEYFIEDFNLR